MATLTPAEDLVVRTLRAWVRDLRRSGGTGTDWKSAGRANAVAEDGLEAFDRFFRALLGSFRRPLDVRCERCAASLGHDEGLLLRAIGAYQAGRHETMPALVGDWVAPHAAWLLVPQLRRFADSLEAAGFRLPVEESSARHRAAVAMTGTVSEAGWLH